MCLLLAFALSACGGGHLVQASSQTLSDPQISAGKVSSSALILGGRVRCTATVTTPVQAGHGIDVTFDLRNVSDQTVKASVVEGSNSLTVRAADGTTYDTDAALRAGGSMGGPYRTPVAIPAGGKARMGSPGVVVRWRGPLRITPGCEGSPLPTLRANVTAPGPPADEASMIDDVVAASGHLLDRCRPQQSGVAVDGQIDAPGGDVAPMDASCSVSIHSEGRFVVAQALVLIPADMQGVLIRQPYDNLSIPERPRPYEAIAWEFVVTKDGATTVAGSMRDATKIGNGMAPGWIWTGSGWSGPDRSRCGFETFSGPAVDFINACPS